MTPPGLCCLVDNSMADHPASTPAGVALIPPSQLSPSANDGETIPSTEGLVPGQRCLVFPGVSSHTSATGGDSGLNLPHLIPLSCVWSRRCGCQHHRHEFKNVGDEASHLKATRASALLLSQCLIPRLSFTTFRCFPGSNRRSKPPT